MSISECLLGVANDDELIEVARLAIENELISRRDSRIGVICANGLVVKERDGSLSPIIRMRSDEVVSFALRAISEHLVTSGRISS